MATKVGPSGSALPSSQGNTVNSKNHLNFEKTFYNKLLSILLVDNCNI